VQQEACAFSSIALTSLSYSFSAESARLLNSWNWTAVLCLSVGRMTSEVQRESLGSPTATFKSKASATVSTENVLNLCFLKT
jgi:hypothetical protein